MSLSNLVVKITYQGNGSNDTFAIPYDPIVNDSSETKVYIRDESVPATPTETLQVEGSMSDYVLDGAVSPGDFDQNVVFNTAPLATDKVIIYRELPLTQLLNFPNDGYNAAALMKALDRIVAMIQQVNNQFTRVPLLPITEQAAQLVMPEPVALQFLRYNAAGTNLELVDIADAVGELLAAVGGLPIGGAAGSVLTKDSATDGDAIWTQYAYSGFSGRFNEAVELANLQETLDYLIDITYTAPTISLGITESSTIYEKGDEVTDATLVATVVKKSDPIAAVRFYLNPSTLLSTVLSGGAIPSGGSSTYNYIGSFDDNVTFRAEVDDDGTSGGPTTVTSTRSFTFVYPYYVGAGAASLAAASVAGLTKRIITESTNRTETITATAGQVLYFAYPASYGTLNSILDVNGFETIGDWTLRVENITGLDSSAVSYNIYEFDNPVTAGAYQYTFKQ